MQGQVARESKRCTTFSDCALEGLVARVSVGHNGVASQPALCCKRRVAIVAAPTVRGGACLSEHKNLLAVVSVGSHDPIESHTNSGNVEVPVPAGSCVCSVAEVSPTVHVRFAGAVP